MIKTFNISLLTKCLNNLALCYIEQFVLQTINKSQVAPLNPKAGEALPPSKEAEMSINSSTQTAKLVSQQLTEATKYELDWAKVVKGDNIVIGAVDVISTRSLIEGFEFEITSKTITARILTDRNKLATANVTLRAVRNHKTERVIVFDRKLNRIGIINDACRFEIIINKTDFEKIKTTSSLQIEVSNLLRNDTTSVEFETQGLLKALASQVARKITDKALVEQTFLQKNLMFNLNYKAKEYLRCPNITQDLEKQFDAMKLRLINEVNDPRLLKAGCPKRKSYMSVQS
ncbi:MAG: hypothetical protein ACTS4V_00445 [Candidatus Hodgkinia cicadicola]